MTTMEVGALWGRRSGRWLPLAAAALLDADGVSHVGVTMFFQPWLR